MIQKPRVTAGTLDSTSWVMKRVRRQVWGDSVLETQGQKVHGRQNGFAPVRKASGNRAELTSGDACKLRCHQHECGIVEVDGRSQLANGSFRETRSLAQRDYHASLQIFEEI